MCKCTKGDKRSKRKSQKRGKNGRIEKWMPTQKKKGNERITIKVKEKQLRDKQSSS